MAWRNPKLKRRVLVPLLLLEIGLVAALSVLYYLSHRDHGFVRVKQTIPVNFTAGTQSLKASWNISYLWTSLPSLFMVLFNLSWNAVIDSLAEETPMRDLAGKQGGSMERTVLLDYRRHLSFIRWWPAYRNGHWFLSACMAFSTVNILFLVPFAAHLFSAAPFNQVKPTIFSLSTSYNASADIATVDYAPILATVTAVRTQGGQWPKGTDGVCAFPGFVAQGYSQTQNVSQWALNVTGYTANLACATITSYDISILPEGDGAGTIQITAADRGCNISLKGGISFGSSTFLKTNSIIGCSAESGLSRISFVAGTYSASAPYLLDAMSVVSCIPSYNKINGELTAPPSLQPLFFEQSNDTAEARPDNWRGFEQDMLTLSNIGDPNSHDFTSAFGELLLLYARTQGLDSSLNPDLLARSASTVFASIFAILAESFLFAPVSADMTVSGYSTVAETRLTVVTWSTFASIGIVSILIILTISLFFYLWVFKPVLPEEPHGILGCASLLHDSTLNELLDEANRGVHNHNQEANGNGQEDEIKTERYNGKFYEWLKSQYVLGDERCTITPERVSASRVISVEHLKRIVRVTNPPADQVQAQNH